MNASWTRGLCLASLSSLLVACGSSPGPSTGEATVSGLSAQFLSQPGGVVGGIGGNLQNSVSILSATSLADLQALLGGIGDLVLPSVEECNGPAGSPGRCWSKISAPTQSIFVAMDLRPTCASPAVAASSAGDVVTFRVRYTGSCPTTAPGAGTLTRPTLNLLSVPLASLPHAVVTVKLEKDGVAGQTTIDLRRPLDVPPEPQLRQAEVQKAISDAKADLRVRKHFDGQLAEFGTQRLASSSSACGQGTGTAQQATSGYVLVLANSRGSERHAYRWASGTLAYCGALSSLAKS
jgi:hypothetical protein